MVVNSFFAPRDPGSSSAESGKPKKPDYLEAVPWVEKYRPRKVDDVVYQDEVVSVLQKCLSGVDLPNMLFYGPPGTGKTSAAVALCRQMFKTVEAYKDRVLELNASDERGIDVVRGRIKNFAKQAVATHHANARIPGLRVIILDEADAMTGPAQAALRRTMETESCSTRFFIICNYVSRIIEPLTSRCAKFRFKPLTTDTQLKRLKFIAEQEKVSIDDDALNELVNLTNGDLRKSITVLQSLSVFGKHISLDDVQEVSGHVPDDVIKRFYETCAEFDFTLTQNLVNELNRASYNVQGLIEQLVDYIMGRGDLRTQSKTKVFKKLGLVNHHLVDGGSEYLALLEIGAVLHDEIIKSDSHMET